jgi:signal transduction histidine kinase
MESLLSKALGQDASQLPAEEKQGLLSRMLGRLAHEIRNPLSSLDIHVQLLEEDLGQLAPETREKLSGRLDIIHGELQRLETIVTHFLRLSSPSELNLEKVGIERVVRNVCELLAPEAEARGIKISARCEGVLPPIMGDPVQLAQALMNLVINAIQAIGRNGQIEVRASCSGDAIHIAVGDTGPGIPADKIAHIFEPYFTTKSDGNGLGLWIAQQIATAHRGEIKAANAPGQGALFTIRLPVSGEIKS